MYTIFLQKEIVYMTKENLNRVDFDTKSQEFTVILANDTRINRIPRKDFISEESQKYQNVNFLFFILDRINASFPSLINTSTKLLISDTAMAEIET